jgi:hypothetical protein
MAEQWKYFRTSRDKTHLTPNVAWLVRQESEVEQGLLLDRFGCPLPDFEDCGLCPKTDDWVSRQRVRNPILKIEVTADNEESARAGLTALGYNIIN